MKLLLTTLSVAVVAGFAASFTSPALRSPVAAETFGIDGAHSTVVFHTKHVGISEAYGRFNTLGEASELVYDAADPSKSSVRIVVQAESVDTGIADRDKHIRGGDFFNSKEFPEIVFESKKVSGKADALTIEGELTFHGVTKAVSAKGHVVGKGDVAMFKDHRAGFVAEFSLNMADFGVEFVKKTPGAVGPEVGVTVSLECVRK
jgi:polyisoprenoid-binding protein YceI